MECSFGILAFINDLELYLGAWRVDKERVVIVCVCNAGMPSSQLLISDSDLTV